MTSVLLKKDERVVAYLHMHVMALMVATLIERQLRRTMKRRSIPSLPLYPEDRPCPYPTLFDIVRAFRGVERYEVLDGQDSCVELPAKLFTNEVVTVEGWVKWREYARYSRFFEFADAAQRIGVMNLAASADLVVQRVLTPEYAGQVMSRAPGHLAAGQWQHITVVAGPNFSRLYSDGQLVALSVTTNGWQPARVPVLKNFLGRSVVKEVQLPGENPDFNGQIAEVRLWAGERTADDIRTLLFQRLTCRRAGHPARRNECSHFQHAGESWPGAGRRDAAGYDQPRAPPRWQEPCRVAAEHFQRTD